MTGFAADRGGSVADAFFGASPVVASALGIRSGATPRGPIHVTTPLRNDTLKPDISTLPELGHFYFALTRLAFGVTGRCPAALKIAACFSIQASCSDVSGT